MPRRHASMFQILRFGVGTSFRHIHFKFKRLHQREEEDVKGKVVVITGANSGLGKQTVEEMAKRGAIVVMACRNTSAGREAQKDIMDKTGSTSVELYHLDLADMESIRSFVAKLLRAHPVIDILVNNGGVMLNNRHRTFTKDGFEMHMGTNHLGHFLLTNLLLDAIHKSTIRRIVTVTSLMCVLSKLDLDDLMIEKSSHLGLRNTRPYINSKFANALFTKELARRAKILKIKAYSVCPGQVKTLIFREYPPTGVWCFTAPALAFALPVDKGADTILKCSLAKKVVHDSGKFFHLGKALPAMDNLLTNDLGRRLWDLSEDLVTFSWQ